MQINKEALNEFLTLQYVIGDHTLRKGEKAKREIDLPKYKLYDNAKISDVEDALKESIKKAVKGKDRIGLLLSGGKDSRLLLGLAKSLDLDITALSITDRSNRSEPNTAAKIAKSSNVPHKILHLSNLLSPNAISDIVNFSDGLINFMGHIPMYYLKDYLSKNFDVVLTGDLVTEIMDVGEYRWYETKDPIKVLKRKHFVSGRALLKEEYLKRVEHKFIDRYKGNSLEEIILDTEIRNRRTRGLMLVKKIGVNISAPVLDGDVISSTLSLPFEKRIHGRLATSILKKSFPDLSRIKTTRSPFPLYFPWWIHFGVQDLKNKIEFAKNGFKIWNGKPRKNKLGMWDKGFYFKYKLKDYIKENIFSLDLEMLDKEAIKKVFNQHMAEQKDNVSLLALLLTVKIWMDNNMES